MRSKQSAHFFFSVSQRACVLLTDVNEQIRFQLKVTVWEVLLCGRLINVLISCSVGGKGNNFFQFHWGGSLSIPVTSLRVKLQNIKRAELEAKHNVVILSLVMTV